MQDLFLSSPENRRIQSFRMGITLSISPHGRLFVEAAADETALDELLSERIKQAFDQLEVSCKACHDLHPEKRLNGRGGGL